MRVTGSRVVITGASSGIGYATARLLARRGCDLVLTGRDEHRLEALSARVNGQYVVADLASAEELCTLGNRLLAGEVPDLIVFAAGIGMAAHASAHADDAVERLLAVNLLAPMRLTRMLLPTMIRRRHGHLVFVSSIAGALGVPMESAYSASKGGLTLFADSLRGEIAGSGVGVTTVLPGVVDTEFFRNRGVPYQRRVPRPIPPMRVAKATVRAVERERGQVVTPRWLRGPIVVRALAPTTYDRLANRLSGQRPQ
ncbi:hypothetical protein CLV47_112123 [Antricoccus suffuscus]|uniref:Ketoreductase domain-containing protein n=1 Tax=Antricoccus suffuscus TaxID=1629062 RepID=A0A2T0ZXL2_9ACTN|nr:SDR family NAD(P)-dependent oxidoreductase [Antricoccus suffuscus]PRZ41090.1 hypothetical protein CLV47_112123 [Antricoccus suffuscus]